MKGTDTHYCSGDEILAGDVVKCAAWTGRIVFVNSSGTSAPGHTTDWSYLGRGFMAEYDQAGLVFSEQADEDLELVARADPVRERASVLRHEDNVVGRVLTEGASPGVVDVSGRFIPGPDYDSYRRAFESARDAAAQVDVAPAADYQEAWGKWKDACQAVELIGLVYGERRAPVEAFGIDSQWHVEFSVPLWWLVSFGGWADAEHC